MFRKQDFKKIDLLGSGKKNTKIYKVEHLPTGRIYALKEIEAKNMDKLNEYKEEAVQLTKIQNHPNVVNFYGYYFYETMYNTFRIALVIEYMDQKYNLEQQFRKRRQEGRPWRGSELERIACSLVHALGDLERMGICHRDIKPANLFVLDNYSIKLIDFGESKDYIMSERKKCKPTLATIRGTPQYLSPILWRAHVIEGNTRHAKHNIYKSDVFSTGLVLMQIALMEDVTGFNQKTTQYDGEKLIEKSFLNLKSKYGKTILSMFNRRK